MAMVDKRKYPEHWFRVAFTSGTAADPETEVMVEFAPVVLSTGGSQGGAPPITGPESKPPDTSASAEFKAPLTIIVKAGGGEVLRLSIPESVKLSTPPFGGARQIVISLSGSVNDLLKLLKPEEAKPAAPPAGGETPPPEAAPPATPPPGATPPIEKGPPVSAGLSVSVQAGPRVAVKVSGTYNLETRQLTTGVSLVLTTPHGDCVLPSGAMRTIVDAVKTLEKFGVTNRAAVGGNPMAAEPKPPAEGPPAPETPPTLDAEQVPEAAVTIGKAIATLVDQIDAIKKAQEQCKKGKPLKVEAGPTVTVPLGDQAPDVPKAPSAGVSLRIFFD